MSDYLFVYGTLSPERAPADVREAVSRMKSIASGAMNGDLYDLGEYPGAVSNVNARNVVRGQVYRLPTDKGVLQKLDAYEEYDPGDIKNSLFVREERPIVLDDGRELTCWVYLYNRSPEKARPIPGGNYFARSAQHTGSPPRAL